MGVQTSSSKRSYSKRTAESDKTKQQPSSPTKVSPNQPHLPSSKYGSLHTRLTRSTCAQLGNDTKLDHHVVNQIHPTSITKRNQSAPNIKKASWDPFARYCSETASSFPDYAAPSDNMPKNLDRLKALSSISGGPVNTLLSQSGTNNRATRNEPPAKKQRLESFSSQVYIKSPHFASKRRDSIHDSIHDSSQGDIWDLRSNSSVGTANHSAAKNALSLGEFRDTDAHIRGNKPGRHRRSRQSQGRTAYSPKCPGAFPEDADSLDDLADEEPSLAMITSDIPGRHGNSKRPRTSDGPELAVKRMRPASTAKETIDLSEDELSVVRPAITNAQGTSHNTIAHNTTSRLTSKSDIATTSFRSSKPAHVTKSTTDICLKKAVSGSHIWEAQPGQIAMLVPDVRNGSVYSFHLEIDKVQVDFSWLKIDLNKITTIRHAATNSCFICITRRLTLGSPPKLCLQFEEKIHPSRFIRFFHEKFLQEGNDAILEKTFQYAIKEAGNYASAKKAADNNSSVQRTSARLHSSSAGTGNESTRQSTSGGGGAESVRREKLTNMLKQSAQDLQPLMDDETKVTDSPPAERSRAVETRRTRRSSPKVSDFDHLYNRWSFQNPEWRQKWHKSLVYPATGRDRATVDMDDITRLDEGEFLNDNLISFYLRYLQVQLAKERPEVLKKVYIFSSFFYEQLKSGRKYEGVKGWTSKVDLLSYDYIVVPVNEHAHWYLAIICNAVRALPGAQKAEISDSEDESDRQSVLIQSSPVERRVGAISLDDEPPISSETVRQSNEILISSSSPRSTPKKSKGKKTTGGVVQKHNPKDPRIITLDSLGNSHSPTCKILRDYLALEAMDKKRVELAIAPPGMTGKRIPEQDNYCDCGVFVLGYMEEFLKDPDEAARRLLQKEPVEWDIRPSQLRTKIRNLLFDLQKEQQGRFDEERDRKRKAWADKKQAELKSKPQNSASPAPTRSSSQGPASRPSVSENDVSASSAVTPCPPATNLPPPVDVSRSETSQAQVVSSPAKMQRGTQGLNASPEPNYISRLNSSEQSEVSGEVPGEDYFTARSSISPAKADLGTGRSTPIKGARRGKYVEQIATSESEAATPNGKDQIRPSIEASDDEKVDTPKRKRGRPKPQPTLSSYFTASGSVEQDKSRPSGPQYGGIERSTES